MNAPSNTWIKVCESDELAANLGACAKVGDHQVAIFKIKDGDEVKLFGISNYDPFSKANVLSRGLVGDLKGHIVVASPIYKQHFDLATGQCLEEADVSLPIFNVRETDGSIEVQLS